MTDDMHRELAFLCISISMAAVQQVLTEFTMIIAVALDDSC